MADEGFPTPAAVAGHVADYLEALEARRKDDPELVASLTLDFAHAVHHGHYPYFL